MISQRIINCINCNLNSVQSYNYRRAKEFQDRKLFVAENVAVLNDFIIEDTDSADSQMNPTFRRSAVEVSGFGKFLTSFFTRLFLRTRCLLW